MLDLLKPLQAVGDAEHPSEPVTLITTEGRGAYPLVGYIGDCSGICSWTADGKFDQDSSFHYLDLENVPEEQKRIDWSKMSQGVKLECLGEPVYFIDQVSPETIKIAELLTGYGDYQDIRIVPTTEIKLIQGPWHPWFGGDCPVPAGVMVSVRFRDEHSNLEVNAGAHNWHYLNEPDPDDIIAYRIEGTNKGWTE